MLATWRQARSWRKVNFRRTDSVLAAEFLHGLYQRHNPFLNPFRFANTAVVFRPWETTSYAPAEEWDRLARRFGSMFLTEPDRTCAELGLVLDNARPRSRALGAELDDLDPAAISDAGLTSALTRLQHVPLGEIYEVNLVQVEHALHAAVRAIVSPHVGAADVDRTIAVLSRSQVATVASDADADFLALVREHRERGGMDPGEEQARLEALAERHREIGSAYGAQTASVSGLAHRLHQFAEMPAEQFELRLRRPIASPGCGRIEDPDLDRMLALLRRTGEVRDQNKLLLGQLTRHRAALLAEIARRRNAAPEALRLYLLEEVIRLIDDGAQVPGQILRRRQDSGVVLLRREGLIWPEDSGLPEPVLTGRPADQAGAPSAWRASPLRGICASPGSHQGIVRLVSAADDLSRMKIGDILVAPGTDFDLILLLRMAGAIVTEEGGLLSHAAVVAREQGTPCLIGVGNATRLLTDGEMVTVDADAGIITRSRQRADAGNSGGDDPMVRAGGAREDRAAGLSGPPPGEPLLVPLAQGMTAERIGGKAAGLLVIRESGLPGPEPVLVVPADICARIQAEAASGGGDTAEAVARQIAAAFPASRVSLRSSSVLEDLADGTAAGVYYSEVGVASDAPALAGAVIKVVGSGTGEAARAYHGRRDREYRAGIALLVTPYLQFDYQGTAVSHSHWDPDAVMVEFFESDGTGGCPDRGGDIVHFPHALLAAAPPRPAIPHLFSDLASVATMTRRISERLDGPAEVEWGVADHQVTVLQARRIAAASDPGALQAGVATHT